MQPARRAGGQTRQNGRAGSGETRCARQPSARADGANGAAQYEVQTTARMISRTYSLNDPSYGHAVVIFMKEYRPTPGRYHPEPEVGTARRRGALKGTIIYDPESVTH